MKIRYCYRDYKFPQKAYFAVIWATDSDGQMTAVLSSQLHKSKHELETYTMGIVQIMNKRNSQINAVNITEIALAKTWPNKKEYWTAIDRQNKIEDGTMKDKIGWLSPFLKSPKLYDLLVVPRAEIGGEMIFDLAKVFLKGNNQGKMEEFMFYSTQVVEPTAKNSAIYGVKKVTSLTWPDKKKTKVLIGIDENDLMD